MAKFAPILVLVIIMANVLWAQSEWAKILEKTDKETTTNLQFYFHDTVSGSNPSAIKVVESPLTSKSLTFFGAMLMADDPLTETSDSNSKLLGRAQGIYGSAGQNDVALIMAMSFNFLDGPYKGSSISMLGKNPAMESTREMPIVGGTGVFRMARGYAIAHTNWMNPITGDAIVGYNVTVIH